MPPLAEMLKDPLHALKQVSGELFIFAISCGGLLINIESYLMQPVASVIVK